jgi:hypothetical protein
VPRAAVVQRAPREVVAKPALREVAALLALQEAADRRAAVLQDRRGAEGPPAALRARREPVVRRSKTPVGTLWDPAVRRAPRAAVERRGAAVRVARAALRAAVATRERAGPADKAECATRVKRILARAAPEALAATAASRGRAAPRRAKGDRLRTRPPIAAAERSADRRADHLLGPLLRQRRSLWSDRAERKSDVETTAFSRLSTAYGTSTLS